MKHSGAPLAALIATLAVFRQLAQLEYTSGWFRTPLLRAIFDPQVTGVLQIDLVGTIALRSGLVFLAVFSVSWAVLSLLASIAEWLRRRR